MTIKAVIFLIFFISHTLHKLTYFLGELIPIRIQSNWQASFASTVPTTLNDTVFKDAIIYNRRADKLRAYFDFTKFVLIWGIFISFLAALTGSATWYVLLKLLFFIPIVALIAFFIIKRIEHCMEWYSFWKVKGFRTMLHLETKPLPEPDRKIQPQLLKRADMVTGLLKQSPVSRIILRTKLLSVQQREGQSE